VLTHIVQVNLRHLGEDGEEGEEEVVRAKFVIGADGASHLVPARPVTHYPHAKAHTPGFAKKWESPWKASKPTSFGA
jgi:hypothetical protein